MNSLKEEDYLSLVQRALDEDVGPGDATTLATVPPDLRTSARIRAREDLVLCGVDCARAVFNLVSAEVAITEVQNDGCHVRAGECIGKVSGPARALLTGERVALNFLQRLSGIATLTSKFVEGVAGTGTKILDTRKTTPGWRQLEKYAVACGGGVNHRFGLYDMILIKDNHLQALAGAEPNAIHAAVNGARSAFPQLKVEVEADRLEQVVQAVEAGAEIVLLDNMSLEQMRQAVALCRGRCQTEASGGVTLGSVRSIAETGVDFISSGALTHSARSVDIALDFDP